MERLPQVHRPYTLVAGNMTFPSQPRKHTQARVQATMIPTEAAAALAVGIPGVLPVSGPWGVWAVLALAGAAGMWAEETRLGKELSGALCATLTGMLLANVGVLPTGAAEINTVYKFVLPLAIPMLLFSANLG